MRAGIILSGKNTEVESHTSTFMKNATQLKSCRTRAARLRLLARAGKMFSGFKLQKLDQKIQHSYKMQ